MDATAERRDVTIPRAAVPLTLAAAGLSPLEERALRTLLRWGELRISDLMAELGLTVDEGDDLVDRMVSAGLVTASPPPARIVAALPPELSVGRRLRAHQRELDLARESLVHLVEAHRAAIRTSTGADLIEIVRGRFAIRQQLRSLQDNAATEMLWLCRAGQVAMSSAENTEEMDALARGVRYRVVYERALLEEPGMIASVELSTAAGEQARAVQEVPVRLAIADRRVAICPLVPVDPGVTEPTAAIIKDSTLLQALLALFDHVWAGGVPLHPAGRDETGPAAHDRTGPVTETERHLLSLVAAGLPDKAIATRSGVSVRTVRRRVAALMARADCRTRIELVWQSARRGWI